jgi:hypothetical protein
MNTYSGLIRVSTGRKPLYAGSETRPRRGDYPSCTHGRLRAIDHVCRPRWRDTAALPSRVLTRPGVVPMDSVDRPRVLRLSSWSRWSGVSWPVVGSCTGPRRWASVARRPTRGGSGCDYVPCTVDDHSRPVPRFIRRARPNASTAPCWGVGPRPPYTSSSDPTAALPGWLHLRPSPHPQAIPIRRRSDGHVHPVAGTFDPPRPVLPSSRQSR